MSYQTNKIHLQILWIYILWFWTVVCRRKLRVVDVQIDQLAGVNLTNEITNYGKMFSYGIDTLSQYFSHIFVLSWKYTHRKMIIASIRNCDKNNVFNRHYYNIWTYITIMIIILLQIRCSQTEAHETHAALLNDNCDFRSKIEEFCFGSRNVIQLKNILIRTLIGTVEDRSII